MDNRLLGEILEERFSVGQEEIDKALNYQQQYGGRLGEILLHSGVLSEEMLAEALAIRFGMSLINEKIKDLSNLEFSPLNDIEPRWFVANEIIPIQQENRMMYFLVKDPLNFYPIEVVKTLFSDYDVRLLLGDERKYREVINLYNMKHFKKEGTSFDETEIEKLRDLAGEAPVIKFVNAMMSRAAEYRASDIHVESTNMGLKVRYRIDGVLHDIDSVSPDTSPAIISRLKIMSNLDIGEKRLPQDGRIQAKVSGRLFDIRISTLPAIHGENIVMRLLEKENVDYNIKSLGLEEPDVNEINRLISKNFGLTLVTGPTGSGKTTTLYSVLNRLNKKDRKIITVEDPVEYQIEGITQIHVHEQIGLSFATILRNILRQDPDIIMIGEIRDRETAEIAIQASLTGHLVLATLHTNDSISAITRLIDMGIDDYLINSSLLGVIAQRLVRRLCSHCAIEVNVEESILAELRAAEIKKKYRLDNICLKKAPGCDWCAHTGYRERIGIFEVLKYTDIFKSMILEHRGDEYIRQKLSQENFRTLREDAVVKCLKGLTTVEEVFRVT